MNVEIDKVVRGNMWIGTGIITVSVCAILSYGFAVRRLGEADAGVVGVVSAILGVSVAIGGLGLALALVREGSLAKGDAALVNSYAGVALVCALLLGIICFAGMFLGAGPLLAVVNFKGDVEDAKAYCILAGLAILLTQWSGVYRALIQARCDFRLSSICDMTYGVLQVTGVIFGILVFPKLVTIGAVNVLAAGIQVIHYRVMVRHSWGTVFKFRWSREAFERLWIFGKWQQLGGLFGVLGDTVDKLVLGVMFGVASVPAYSMARSFYSQCHTILASQTYQLFPRLAGEGKGSLDLDLELRLIAFISFCSSWIYLGVFLVGPILIAVISGGDFAAKVNRSLPMFCVIGWMHSLCLVVYFVKLASGYSRLVSIMNSLSGPVTLIAMISLGLVGGLRWAIAGQLAILSGVTWLLSLDEGNTIKWHLLLRRISVCLPHLFSAVIFAVSGYWVRSITGYLSVANLMVTLLLVTAYLPLVNRCARIWPFDQNVATTVSAVVNALPIKKQVTRFLCAVVGCAPMT